MNDGISHSTSPQGQAWSMALADESATAHWAACLARALPAGVVHLQGGLGAGKTTLTRHWLQALGHQGAVKSPTYTLVEPYQVGDQPIYHFDLYRLDDPYELELMGLHDYLEQPNALLLIEWPSKGEPVIPPPDWRITLHEPAHSHGTARQIEVVACSVRGAQALQQCHAASHVH
ncbi:MAG: hypothetical protein RL180_1439 [Pseudomonadota bacterium]